MSFPTALNAARLLNIPLTLMNPFRVSGVYPEPQGEALLLPFELPHPELLEDLPFGFNTVPTWDNLSYTQQLEIPTSAWHRLTNRCVVSSLSIPMNHADFQEIVGPMRVETIGLETPLSLDNPTYSLLITRYVGDRVERQSVSFFSGLLQMAYLSISRSFVDTYMKVIDDILEAAPNRTIRYKGQTIGYVGDVLTINNTPYPFPDLPLVGWLMYILFT